MYIKCKNPDCGALFDNEYSDVCPACNKVTPDPYSSEDADEGKFGEDEHGKK